MKRWAALACSVLAGVSPVRAEGRAPVPPNVVERADALAMSVAGALLTDARVAAWEYLDVLVAAAKVKSPHPDNIRLLGENVYSREVALAYGEVLAFAEAMAAKAAGGKPFVRDDMAAALVQLARQDVLRMLGTAINGYAANLAGHPDALLNDRLYRRLAGDVPWQGRLPLMPQAMAKAWGRDEVKEIVGHVLGQMRTEDVAADLKVFLPHGLDGPADEARMLALVAAVVDAAQHPDREALVALDVMPAGQIPAEERGEAVLHRLERLKDAASRAR